LLADDEIALTTSLGRLLKERKYSANFVFYSNDAIQALSEKLYDVVVQTKRNADD